MRVRSLSALIVASAVLSAAWLPAAEPQASDSLENLALKASISASTEYSEKYLAKFVADGKLPPAGSHADLNQAWCVQGRVERQKGELQFVWETPVTVSTLVYYGRTAWFMSECWKDYEVCLDDAREPVAKGRFEMVHGPQCVSFPEASISKLTLRFTSSYDGPNPGASEVQIFSGKPTARHLQRLTRDLTVAAGGMYLPAVDEVDTSELRTLIDELVGLHKDNYCDATHHAKRLSELEQALQAANASSDQTRIDDIEQELAELQRAILLFDVDQLIVIKRHEISASHVYTYHYEGFRAGGGLYLISLRDTGNKPVELVASPTGQILDCDLSHDGSLIVFSWRRKEDEGYHLWTVRVDGSGLTQLTDGPWHDYNACWLPDGDIAFLTTRSPQFAYCWHAPVGVLHRMKPDGTDLRQLSANYLNDFTPQVLEDGRLIYTRWEYVDRPAIPIQSLWTINPDGTGLAGYFGNRVISPGTFMEARPIPGTGKIICTMTGHNGPTRGAIGVIDRTKGVNAQAAIENVTPEVEVPPVDQGNGNTSGAKPYSSPLPLDATRFLVSARGPVLVRTLSGPCQATAIAAPNEGMQYFNAQPVRARKRPPVVPSKLNAAPDSMATIFLQNVYDGLEPYVRRGEVTKIRVVRDMQKTVRIDPSLRAFGFQFPVISCGATYAAKDVLGDVPVEVDGSAYFRVPAGTNISFMAMDAEGRAVQRMRSFTHLMPGERQGCVGCHEHRQKTPGEVMTLAMAHPPRDLQVPEFGAGGFDYARIVQPVLDAHCIECHDAIDPPKGIDLTGGRTDYFNVSYDVLARENQGQRGSPYVNWIPTYNGQEWNILEVQPKTWGSPQSVLADLVLTGHPDEDGNPRVVMDADSVQRILAWIDLNVPYYGTSETAHPERQGCRRIYPDRLDEALADVAQRRCSRCHADGNIPRRVWTRITEPELNPFLVAPLAASAGGSQKCGEAVFLGKDDADYQAILATFQPVLALLEDRPRMDMAGAEPACDVCRSSQ
jgi:hypothetical protein